jgi:acyl carrier protein
MATEQMDEIRKGFAERLKLDKIDESKSLKDLGLDSLDVVEMCLDLEDKYQIQFTTEELSSFKTIGDLLSSIEKKLGEKK